MAMISGGQLAAEALVQKGIDVIFTLSGGHITPIYEHLENTEIELFDTRHEQAAGFMAEAYGRMNRKPGVVMITAGPGFTNVLTPVANACQANSPMLIISGAVGVTAAEKLDLQDMRQGPIIEPMVKKTFVCHTTSRIPEFVDMAYRTAMSGRPGPVYLEIPVDILNQQVEADNVTRPNTLLNSSPVDRKGAAELMNLLQQAEKPVIMAGNGAWYANAGEELKKFVETCNIPVLTMGMGRGLISDDHPLCLESSVGVRPGGTLVAQSMSDLVIFLGNRLSLFYMFGNLIMPTTKIVQVDIEGSEIGRNRSVDLPIVSDIRGLLQECNELAEADGLGGKLNERFAGWAQEMQAMHEMGKGTETHRWASDAEPIHPLRVAAEVNKFMSRDTDIVVADGGDTQVWMGMTRTVKSPASYFDSGLYGCLGVGLPFANTAKHQRPASRVCLVIGDGSVGFNFMEFETALRKQLPIVVVVANDLGWGMIRHSQELRMGHAIENGTWIGEVPYEKMIESLGGFGKRVEKPGDIAGALEEAFASGKPALINVRTDTTTVSPGSIALANVGAYGK